MRNIIDYTWDENRTFAEKSFTEVDSLVLSQLSYMNFTGLETSLEGMAAGNLAPVSLAEFLEAGIPDDFFKQAVDEKHNRELISVLRQSHRFASVGLAYYVNSFDVDTEKQFSALTFLLEDGTAYVAFRGTDATFIGWKEDFNMAFMTPIPSQEEAADYLRNVHGLIGRPLRIGGHSKGGNLAVYAALRCADRMEQDIIAVYDHDGPGFHEDIHREFKDHPLWKKVKATVPHASIIGMLLHNNLAEYTIVGSRRVGILQHDPFSWKISPEGDFVVADGLSPDAVVFNRTMEMWLSSLDDEGRERFIDALYSVVKATGAVTFQDLTEDIMGKLGSALAAIKELDPDTRSFIRRLVYEWFKAAVVTIKDFATRKITGEEDS
ncbi:Mbeg1-like protein [Parasphaerochaeta coccoides]|uniref:DUF2974 domain-containing protein n=1 Tax=Parasphaerochaeta coccoides (strain ATCC BAA-1237 / DSM 17374 / SPN1) TaxID=760011 RepID=F4GM53_PARC1|nr:Mbeg1-like protein [Parasphaerochaeta coccoides]AEC02528.1 hypothetical protein Spico_1321 [Parasphaerochaeta coccoides DSM 17374]